MNGRFKDVLKVASFDEFQSQDKKWGLLLQKLLLFHPSHESGKDQRPSAISPLPESNKVKKGHGKLSLRPVGSCVTPVQVGLRALNVRL